MTALDAQYHNKCLTALTNTERTITNAKSEFNKQQGIDGIEVGEIIICIICKRDQTDTDVNSTRIKEMLIKYARLNNYKKSNNKVFIKFAENLGAVIDFSTKMTLTMLQSY